MAVSGHLLILLLPVLSLCGATEYYVRPTEPTNTSCPAQPCLTLSQYTSDSDHYFKSNTVFKFLPGTHHMDRPLTIGHVHNMSLESLSSESDEYPHLVAQFPCDTEVHKCVNLPRYRNTYVHDFMVCCAAVWLHDVYNVTLKEICITAQMSNKPISGVILNNVSSITVQLNATCSLSDLRSFGFTIYDAISVNVLSSSANNCSFGFVLHNTTNTRVTKVTAMHNEIAGIAVHMATNTQINNTLAASNTQDGMVLATTSNTCLVNVISTHNDESGIKLFTMNNTRLTNTITSYNSANGIILYDMINTSITNMTASYNGGQGIKSIDMSNTGMNGITAAHNDEDGMKFLKMNNTDITNVTTSYNGEHGIDMSYINNMFIMNVSTADNSGDGMKSFIVYNTDITNMITSHNHGNGMTLFTTSDADIVNVTAAHNREHGLSSFNMSNTGMTNMTTVYNDQDGMSLSNIRYTSITNTTATHNSGVAIYLLSSQNTNLTKTRAMHNKGMRDDSFGILDGQVTIMSSSMIIIYDTSFTDVPAQNTEDLICPSVLVMLYQSTLLLSGCDFMRNNMSALGAYASNITISGDLTFSDNRAFAGTAFILIENSVLILAENSHIYFLNNHATNTGGVFYITRNNVDQVMFEYHYDRFYPRSNCFLRAEGSRSLTRFTFANNSAGKGGDILYGGQVALGLDGDQNCLDSSMDSLEGQRNCLNSFRNVSNISQDGLSLISSDPSRVCLCNGTGQPDCLVIVDPTPHTVYPGQTITISAVVVGQVFGTVAGSVYAQFLQRGSPPQLESGQEVQGVTQHKCNHLYYTIFSWSEVSEAVLVLTAQDSFVLEYTSEVDYDKQGMGRMYCNTHAIESIVYSNNPVYVNISLIPCPPGFMLTNHSPFRCDCNSLLQQMHRIKCHIQEQTIGRSGLQWVGMIQDDNGTNGTVAASEYCPQDYCSGEVRNVILSEPDSQCNHNHSGTLCGGCQPGLSLALGSARCLQCSNKYLALLIPLALAGPVLVFSIKLLDLTMSQGTLNGLIFYANVVRANEYIFLPQGQTNPLTVFIAWLNLDLGVETCLFQGLTAYSKTWLQFVFPFYIWSIAGLIIILARYSDRVAKVMGNNSVSVLATLFLLSYAKLLRTIITALSYTMVYTSHGSKAVWPADGNVDYLGPQHAPLFAAAVAVLLFLWLPYTLLLFLGQWLHRCNYRLVVRMLMRIKPFLDAHYGPLKSKHHYWFGALLLARAVTLLISALIPANHSSIVVLCISVSAVVLTYFGLLVYRNLAVAMFDTTFYVNLALLTAAYSFTTTTAGGDLSVSSYTLIGVAFVQFVGLVLFKVFSILKQSKMVMVCLHKKTIY